MPVPLLGWLRAALTEDWQSGGFGLYLHWPFCAAKCPYCDFNSHVSRQIDHAAWRKAYLQEIDRYAEMLPGRVLNSVFLGGGTPSLMEPDTVVAVIERIRQRWPTANDLEITLEANPGSVEAGRFRAYAEGGVSRVSMGVQALHDRDLQRLGRIHSVAEARRAFDIARAQFSRVSFDLIYARQDQSLADWQAELTEALGMAVDHLSLYQLTIEPGTAFGARYDQGSLRGLPTEDLSADMYELTRDLCNAAGMEAYEVSNHARPGAESHHNLIYWRYGDYIGIGPGAHGRLTLNGVRHATETWSNPDRWLKSVDEGTPDRTFEPIGAADQGAEYLLMGLRISEGIDIERYSCISGMDLPTSRLAHMTDIGVIVQSGSRLQVTDKGRLMLNAVLSHLLAG